MPIEPLCPVVTKPVLPLVFDESLSYYELLCKCLNKENELIDTVNDHEERIETLENDKLGKPLIVRVNSTDIDHDEIYWATAIGPLTRCVMGTYNETIKQGNRPVGTREIYLPFARKEMVHFTSAVENDYEKYMFYDFNGIVSNKLDNTIAVGTNRYVVLTYMVVAETFSWSSESM